MRAQLRIVSGALRGRKVICNVQPNLRPTPDMVRAALFSILGHAVPERPFFDVFAGTGVVGLEAISRGASRVTFVERDFRVAAEIERHLKDFGVADRAVIARADTYRWGERWEAPAEPVNVFFSPPFADFERRPAEFLGLVRLVQQKVAPGSVVVVQSERGAIEDEETVFAGWDLRRYGRNELLIWVREEDPSPPTPLPEGARGEVDPSPPTPLPEGARGESEDAADDAGP
ncbi:MAG TPA: RsmD family RNA methyltransferase [Gemmataceae bacterium]|nr:RsmD family RNA methyltransferase [Gemmataceae bacterium]